MIRPPSLEYVWYNYIFVLCVCLPRPTCQWGVGYVYVTHLLTIVYFQCLLKGLKPGQNLTQQGLANLHGGLC